MKLLLDTTYFLPTIGVAVKYFPRNIVIELINKGYSVLVSEITLFELSAKGAKYVASGLLKAERVIRGIKALFYDDRVRKVPVHETSALLTALELRKLLSDFIDCLILSASLNYADALITEDEDIHMLLENEKFLKIIQEKNPEFEIMNYSTLKNRRLSDSNGYL